MSQNPGLCRRSLSYAIRTLLLPLAGLAIDHFAGGAGPVVATPLAASARALVEALANRNPPPQLVKWQGRYPIFPSNFEWREDGRVYRALRTLIEHAETSWPEMVRHLGDARYCITVDEALSCEYALNWTVGEACREIIVGTLTTCYAPRLGSLNKITFARFQFSELTGDAKKLQAWCEARSARPLFELQIEFCQTALAEVAHGQWPPELVERRRHWAAALEAEIQSLRASKKPCHFQGFGESMRPYSAADSAGLRNRHGKAGSD
jgi:hypothetical protein